jgi:site-specific DNA recombinase
MKPSTQRLPNTPLPKKRCAMYCRVSTDERLDQEYNSLEAQRDSGCAYVASQRHEGWLMLDNHYVDGGFSGGNLERPALKRLLADVDAGRVDVIVVYKLDRLTRSLADFAKIVDVLDQRGVTFVSVTQQFNTTTSMGRLTLNILLSFAQFEREVTSERIRDKIAASKAKGMWMGGSPPLGYDVVARKLVINAPEAELVRDIYQRFAEHGSAARLVRELAHEGHTTKVWTTQSGKARKGNLIDQQYLFKLLRNRLYLGEMTLRNETFPGQHARIVPEPLWAAVVAVIASRQQGVRKQSCATPALLTGLLFAPDGQRMLSTFTQKGNGRRYRYYAPYLHKRRHAGATLTPGVADIGPLPAAEIEAAVMQHIEARLRQPEMLVAAWQAAARSEAGRDLDEPHALVALQQMGEVWQQLFPAEQQRIAQLLIERVQIHARGLDITWRDDGWLGFGAEIRHHPFVHEQCAPVEEEALT